MLFLRNFINVKNDYTMKKIKTIDELASFLKKELGLENNDTINIITPQFERDFEIEIDFIPKSGTELKTLIESAPKDILQKMGVCIWTTYDSEVADYGKSSYLKPQQIHYLFPKEWYDYIPDGFEIINVLGEKEIFKRSQTDNDIRFGCLAYGFVRNF